MRWPALRLHIRANLLPSLRGRVDFHISRYRDPGDGAYGRAWVTVDGERVGEGWAAGEFLGLLSEYVDIPPAEALRSETGLWRALAAGDRRLSRGSVEAASADGEADAVAAALRTLRLGADPA
ncbi:MAG: hypothetical protein KGL53_02465 [Elusimicrobia bacterium]|nr:hypothetical protein [Elusimicrobiota bacterium]